MFLTTQNLEKSLLQTKVLLSKSDDELSMENYDTNNDSLLHTKHISNSTGSLNTPTLRSYKDKRKAILMKFVNINEEQIGQYHDWNINKSDKGSYIDESINSKSSNANISLQDSNKELRGENNTAINTDRLSRQLSEPPDMYSSQSTLYETSQNELYRQSSEPTFSVSEATHTEMISITKYSEENKKAVEHSKMESHSDNACVHLSPVMKNRLWNVYVAHTSTPSNLLRKSLVTNDYMLTPITNNDKSMSPITQSATKMTKAMQVWIYNIIHNTIISYVSFYHCLLSL